jgi:hypothetical protein
MRMRLMFRAICDVFAIKNTLFRAPTNKKVWDNLCCPEAAGFVAF